MAADDLLGQDAILQPGGVSAAPVIHPIVIEELIGDLVCTLSEHELPYGRRHELAAFESGVEVDIAEDGIYNPGSDRVTIPVMQPRYLPMQLKGRFHDAFFPNDRGHARKQRDLLTKIAQRANPVRVTWGDDERQGLLRIARFGEESEFDIAYDLTFFVAIPPTGTAPQREDGLLSPSDDPTDIVDQLRAQAADQQSELAAVALRAEVASVYSSRYASVGAALDALSTATLAFSTAILSNPHQALSAARNVVASAKATADQFQSLKAYTEGLDAASASAYVSGDNDASWWAWSYNTQDDTLGILDQLRTIAQVALTTLRKSTRLYRVQEGDTMESIAFQQLGSRGRSLDLGISQADLVVGNFVRIPEKA
jgi:hypothetical protein